ncbi:MAG TPA: nucleotidyltransferase family protein [Bacteroidales bacterium]|nr:nucleotidyltransferase family protein [Bacteroidales bacterium]
MPGICAIILAAGESKRMGSPKMLLDFSGFSMIETVIRNVRESSVDDIVVVLGAYRDEIQKIVNNTGIKSCYNDIYKEGMLSSVQCGFRNIPERTEAVLVFQGDQPLITSEVADIVINEFKRTGKGIIIPVYNKKRGHPLLIAHKYFEEVGNLDPQRGLRSLSEIFSEDVKEVSVKEAGILRDFDTFDQYKKAINQI